MKHVETSRDELVATKAEQGFALAPEDSLLPIFSHRYLVCAPNPASSVVLSIADETDAIAFGKSLEEYLKREFLSSAETHHRW